MTREEAIQLIDEIASSYYPCDKKDALEIAIKALERESQTFEWCTDCREYDQEKHCCHRWSKVIRSAVEEIKQEAYEDAIAVREFGLDDFIEFGKKAFGVELTFKKSDDPDTYEKLFGISQEAKTGYWIPVSEKFPEYGEAVLTINTHGDYEINHIVYEDRHEWLWDDNVVAWMPLPEFYKPQESENA